jgi:serine protease AprX
MKRWFALAACVALSAACQDQSQPVGPSAAPPSELLGIGSTVKVDPVLRNLLSFALPTDRLEVLVTYDPAATTGDAVAEAMRRSGVGIIRFRQLPIVAGVDTPPQITSLLSLNGVKSVFSNKQLRYHLAESIPSIRGDVAHRMGYTGKGVGIAIVDSGVDGFHSSDVGFPGRTVANIKVGGSLKDLATFGAYEPKVAGDLYLEDIPNTETSSGHGTHVAGIAAGDGSQSRYKYVGVAPDANVVGIGAGDVLFVFWALAGYDYILENQARFNIQVVNNSWGGEGVFDPTDPTNVATKVLYDRGITVVFAAGNAGPGENTLNPYSVAPWVIGVAASCKAVSPDPTNSASQCGDGRQSMLADFSSRGIPGDALYHPDITAPGVNIVSTRGLLGRPTCSTATSPTGSSSTTCASAAPRCRRRTWPAWWRSWSRPPTGS